MGVKEFSRAVRVADQIQRELAHIIDQDLRDPGVTNVTVSEVDVSRDLRNATIYIAAPSGADMGKVLASLHRATGFLRTRLAKRIRIRYMPRLRFVHDTTLDRADRISQLLNTAPKPADQTLTETGSLSSETEFDVGP